MDLHSLANLQSLRAAWTADRQDVIRSWRVMEAESSRRAVETYRTWIENPVQGRHTAEVVGLLLEELGYQSEACVLWNRLASFYRQNGLLKALCEALIHEGVLLRGLGDLDGAQARHREQRELCDFRQDRKGVVRALGNEALTLQQREDLAGALALYEEAIQVCKEINLRSSLHPNLLVSRGRLLEKIGDPESALFSYRESEELAQDIGAKRTLVGALGNQVTILKARGDFTGALHLLTRRGEVLGDLNDQRGIEQNQKQKKNILKQLAQRESTGEWPPLSGGVIRVFVSSTFLDMQEERDDLAKYVFPALRKKCEEKGIPWSDVDLRWGITNDQLAEGRMLDLCLTEIDRCRPFFLGLLGSRYGSYPDRISPELLAREPWIEDFLDRSITELEMLHGALNEPEKAQYAFFYFREIPSDSPLDIGHQKLEALKDRIRRSPVKIRLYRGVQELREIVAADFNAIIDASGEAQPERGELALIGAEQEAFLSLKAAEVYVERDSDLMRLDKHVQGQEGPLVVCGAPGAGKTALLAWWILRHRRDAGGERLLFHFIVRGSDLRGMLSRLTDELRRQYDLPEKLLEGLGLGGGFAHVLRLGSAKGRGVLVLDGLDQLEDREGALSLSWLPREIPVNVRLIVSTSGGPTFSELVDRGWTVFEVAPLAPPERSSLIQASLASYGRNLEGALVERIAGAEGSALALYLCTLLEEIRFHGDHTTLPNRIDHYIAATGAGDLFVRVLERYERDYEGNHPGLVREALSALWAAKRGLFEAELLDLLGANGERLPASVWSPLYDTVGRFLLRHSGLLVLQNALRRAVERRYLTSDDDRSAAHLVVAAYFRTRKIDFRKLEELPWQLAAAHAWSELYELLRTPSFLGVLWERGESEVRAYWAQLEEHSECRLVEGYRFVYDKPQDVDIGFAAVVALLLTRTGYHSEALRIYDWLIQHHRTVNRQAQLASALNDQGLSLMALQEFDGALSSFLEGEAICRRIGNRAILNLLLVNRAVLLMRRDASTVKIGLRDILGRRKRPRPLLIEAMQILQEQEALSRELKNLRSLGLCLANQGAILTKLEDSRALDVLRQAESLLVEIGDRVSLAGCLLNQCLVLVLQGKRQAGIRQLDRCEAIHQELGNQQALAEIKAHRKLLGSLGMANIFDPVREIVDYSEEERRLREIGKEESAIPARMGQAYILASVHDSESKWRGLELYRQIARSCHESGDRKNLQESLFNIGALLMITLTPTSTALPIFAEALELAQEDRLPFSWIVLQGTRAMLVFCRPLVQMGLRFAFWMSSKVGTTVKHP